MPARASPFQIARVQGLFWPSPTAPLTFTHVSTLPRKKRAIIWWALAERNFKLLAPPTLRVERATKAFGEGGQNRSDVGSLFSEGLVASSAIVRCPWVA